MNSRAVARVFERTPGSSISFSSTPKRVPDQSDALYYPKNPRLLFQSAGRFEDRLPILISVKWGTTQSSPRRKRQNSGHFLTKWPLVPSVWRLQYSFLLHSRFHGLFCPRERFRRLRSRDLIARPNCVLRGSADAPRSTNSHQWLVPAPD